MVAFEANLDCTGRSFSLEAFTLIKSSAITSNVPTLNHLRDTAIVALSLSLALALKNEEKETEGVRDELRRSIHFIVEKCLGTFQLG
jgi:hypothetical protein